jgi:proteic killer suppression protein
MILTFADQGSEDVFDGTDSKAARMPCPRQRWSVARRKIDMVLAACRLDVLKVPPANHLKALRGDRSGLWSIRINDQYRVCFRWDGQDAHEGAITDYH